MSHITISADAYDKINRMCQGHIDDKLAISKQLALANRKLEVAMGALHYYGSQHMFPNDGPWGVSSQDFGTIARTAITTINEMKEYRMDNSSTTRASQSELHEPTHTPITGEKLEKAARDIHSKMASIPTLDDYLATAKQVLTLREQLAALTAERNRLREALAKADASLIRAFNRIHCLPRTSDTELATNIDFTRTLIKAALQQVETKEGE